jgi:Electron transfer DM13.
MTTTDSPPSRPTPAPGRRKKLLAGLAVIVVVGVAVTLAVFEPWRLFTRSTVDEALPVQVSTVEVAAGPSAQAPASTPAPEQTGSPNVGVPATSGPAAVGEPGPTPPAQPMALASGAFVDGEHATSGTASILQLPDGSRYVRLENFSTSDGPDVQVWLTDKAAGGSDWGKYDDGVLLSLGELKATDGNQNYPIPADANLSAFTSVVIWCDRFNVAFGTAPIGMGT